MKYRKKPVVIEAVQWTGNNASDIEAFVGSRQTWETWEQFETLDEIRIPTLEGVMTASKGDWIIRGVKGELYPCKPDIFAVTYEAVEEHETVATPNNEAQRQAGETL